MDANYGCLLTGNGQGKFNYVPQSNAGLSVVGDVKSVVPITINKTNELVIGAFNQPLQVYKQTRP